MATHVDVRHTAMLDSETLEEIRGLMIEAFGGRFSTEDWDHTIGGMHVLVREGDRLVAHGSVVQRRLLHDGRALRCGYVEGVAVRAERRRHGFGALVMGRIEDIVRRAYDIGALSASEAGFPFYVARGWQVWGGPTSVLTPAGAVRTPEDDGSVMVWGGHVPLNLDGPLGCDWRDGDAW